MYNYAFDMGIESVIALIDMNGIPCEHQKPVVVEGLMNRKTRTYLSEDDLVYIVPIPLGIKEINNGAGYNQRRTLKAITDSNLVVQERIIFNSVTYEVRKVEEQGRDCTVLYQVWLEEVLEDGNA